MKIRQYHEVEETETKTVEKTDEGKTTTETHDEGGKPEVHTETKTIEKEG